jgi:hypothetical protein
MGSFKSHTYNYYTIINTKNYKNLSQHLYAFSMNRSVQGTVRSTII